MRLGALGGRKSIFSMLSFVLFLIVLIGLSANSVSQLYCSKDNYKQKQRNTLPVTMITEIEHLIMFRIRVCVRYPTIA